MERGLKPPKITEWIAPMRAQASIATAEFGDHAHVNRHAVALANAARTERVGHPAGLFIELAIRQRAVVAGLVALQRMRDLSPRVAR